MHAGETAQGLLAECSASILEYCPGLDAETTADMESLTTCLGKSYASARKSAWDRLKELQAQDDYAGVLCPLFRLPRWEALMLEIQAAGAGPRP
eukprot:1050417-Heterocapsa_arctica.AAC.1